MINKRPNITEVDQLDSAIAVLQHMKSTALEIVKNDDEEFVTALAIAVHELLPDDYPMDVLDAALNLAILCDN